MHYKRVTSSKQVWFLSRFLSICSIVLFVFFCLRKFDEHERQRGSLSFLSEATIECSNTIETSDVKTKPLKTILLYNEPHFIITDHFGVGHEPFVQHNCPVPYCAIYLTPTDEIPLKAFDAVLFYVLKLKNYTTAEVQKLVAPDPDRRSPHQRYIFYNVEPPLKMRRVNWNLYDNFYNWTMTYKKESDIWTPYGMIEALPNIKPSPDRVPLPQHAKAISDYVQGKNKLVAWFVSHCFSDGAREVYVQKLKKYINIDIYGKCGNFSCPRIPGTHYSEETCYDMADKTYKFYLSFESSFCNEYVTEKLFSVLKRYIVPIVYGKADYKSLLPEHSYINAMDYTPKELAKYLDYLDKNSTAYQEYFWWKPYYRLHGDWDAMSPIAMCKLCEKLHEPVVPKSYRDIGLLHGVKMNCLQRPEVLRSFGKLGS